MLKLLDRGLELVIAGLGYLFVVLVTCVWLLIAVGLLSNVTKLFK